MTFDLINLYQITIDKKTKLEVDEEKGIHIFMIGKDVVINKNDIELVLNKYFVLLKGNEIIIKHVTDIKEIQENKEIKVFGRVLYTIEEC